MAKKGSKQLSAENFNCEKAFHIRGLEVNQVQQSLPPVKYAIEITISKEIHKLMLGNMYFILNCKLQ